MRRKNQCQAWVAVKNRNGKVVRYRACKNVQQRGRGMCYCHRDRVLKNAGELAANPLSKDFFKELHSMKDRLKEIRKNMKVEFQTLAENNECTDCVFNIIEQIKNYDDVRNTIRDLKKARNIKLDERKKLIQEQQEHLNELKDDIYTLLDLFRKQTAAFAVKNEQASKIIEAGLKPEDLVVLNDAYGRLKAEEGKCKMMLQSVSNEVQRCRRDCEGRNDAKLKARIDVLEKDNDFLETLVKSQEDLKKQYDALTASNVELQKEREELRDIVAGTTFTEELQEVKNELEDYFEDEDDKFDDISFLNPQKEIEIFDETEELKEPEEPDEPEEEDDFDKVLKRFTNRMEETTSRDFGVKVNLNLEENRDLVEANTFDIKQLQKLFKLKQE